ncbi:unnamed protein product [Closterium sp. NIES-54]
MSALQSCTASKIRTKNHCRPIRSGIPARISLNAWHAAESSACTDVMSIITYSIGTFETASARPFAAAPLPPCCSLADDSTGDTNASPAPPPSSTSHSPLPPLLPLPPPPPLLLPPLLKLLVRPSKLPSLARRARLLGLVEDRAGLGVLLRVLAAGVATAVAAGGERVGVVAGVGAGRGVLLVSPS